MGELARESTRVDEWRCLRCGAYNLLAWLFCCRCGNSRGVGV